MENAIFKLGTNFIEISGPQEFVEDQLEKFRDLIEASYEKILNQPVAAIGKEKDVQKSQLLISPEPRKEYADFVEVNHPVTIEHENVFTLENGRFHIHADLEKLASSTRERMICVVLIYLWAQLRKGVDTIAFGELRDICMNAGEFDSSNFAKAMDHNKRYFVLGGEGKSRTAKLVPKGIKEAERIINELNKL